MKNNFIINALITKQIAAAYVIYRNDRIANDLEDDIISFEQYAELFALCLKCNLNEINELCDSVNKKIADEKKQAKIDKKVSKMNKKVFKYPVMGNEYLIDEQEVKNND